MPIILLLISGGVFFMLIDPGIQRVKEVRKETLKYTEALSKSRQTQDLRDVLLAKYNTFATNDLEDLKKMVPDHVDNVRLIIEIDNIASQYGMTVRDAQISSNQEEGEGENIVIDPGRQMEEMTLSFSVISDYDSFLSFIRDLEQSLRIVDIENVEFESSEADLNEYTVTVKTYWLSSEH